MKKIRSNKKKGFTLIELIVVIAILGILAAILIPSFSGIQKKANEKATLAEARTVATAVQAYHADNPGAWASTVSQLNDYGVPSAMNSASAVSLGANGAFTYTSRTVTINGSADGTVSVSSGS